MSKKSLTVLGSTGSIGKNTLDVVARFPDRFRIHALAVHSNIAELAGQIEAFKPKVVAVCDPQAAERLREQRPGGGNTTVLSGMDGVLEVSTAANVHQVVAAMVGAAGLRPVYAAVEAGKQVAVANKEVMVLAGELMVQRARESGSMLLPLDSEHNAVFQCLNGNARDRVKQIVLTASGGPFRDTPLEAFASITREQALNHPNWRMGPKITIDSATMMNKGLEVIEARWFFDLQPEQIAVVIHRQSIVHSLVEFVDGSMLGQLGLPDMRTPITHCLSYPDRLPLDLPRLNLAQVGRLDFEEVGEDRYPSLFLALQALRAGGGAPAALNGANESVVAAYLEGAFPFIQIAGILKEVMERIFEVLSAPEAPAFLRAVRTVDDAIAADGYGRKLATEQIALAVHAN